MFEHSDVQRYGAAIEGRSLADAQKWAHELVIALTVYPISVRHNYFAGNWHICVGQADPVKLDLQISLSEEVPRFLSRFQVALQVAAPWEDRSPKLLKTAEAAQNRVADVSSGRGEIGFVQGTVQKRSGRHNDFLSAYARLAQKKTKQRHQRVSTPHVGLLISGQGAQTVRTRRRIGTMKP
jgi:hypothetical protein